MMDKQKAAEAILNVLQRGALVGPDEKQELWIRALVAGIEQAERVGNALTGIKLYEALSAVKEHCTSQGTSCYGCLLSTDAIHGGCDFFEESPEDWDLEFLKGE